VEIKITPPEKEGQPWKARVTANGEPPRFKAEHLSLSPQQAVRACMQELFNACKAEGICPTIDWGDATSASELPF
jgi:hypothetical protein